MRKLLQTNLLICSSLIFSLNAHTQNNCNLLCNGDVETPNVGGFFLEVLTACQVAPPAGQCWTTSNSINIVPFWALNPCNGANTSSPDIMDEDLGFLGAIPSWDDLVNPANEQQIRLYESEGISGNCNYGNIGYNEGLAQTFNPANINSGHVLEYMTACQGNGNPILGVFLEPDANVCSHIDNVNNNCEFIQDGNAFNMNYTYPGLVPNQWDHVVNVIPAGTAWQSLYITTGPGQLSPDGFTFASMRYLVDDICLTPISQDPISADAWINVDNNDIEEATGCVFDVSFSVWTDWNGTNANPILLQIQFPLGDVFNILYGSDFNADGQLTIPIGGIGPNPLEYHALIQFDGSQMLNQNYAFQLASTGPTGCLCHMPFVIVNTNLPVPSVAGITNVIPGLCSYGYDGGITVQATGGTPGATNPAYTYGWFFNGEEYYSANQIYGETGPDQNGIYQTVVAGAGVGTFLIAVLDANGCLSPSVIFQVTPDVLQQDIILTQISEVNADCSMVAPGQTGSVTYQGTYSPVGIPYNSIAEDFHYELYEGFYLPINGFPDNPIQSSGAFNPGISATFNDLAVGCYTLLVYNQTNPGADYNSNCYEFEWFVVGDQLEIKLDRIVSPFCTGQNGLGSILIDAEAGCNETPVFEWINLADPNTVISTSEDLIDVPPANYFLTVTYGPCTETFSYDLSTPLILDGNPTWDTGPVGNSVVNINSNQSVSNQNLIFGQDVSLKEGFTWTLDDCIVAFTNPSELELLSSSALTSNAASLIANNTIFTSACNTYWDGIQVTATITQSTAATPYEHRSLVDMDNCSINYAFTGLKNHRESITFVPANTYGDDGTNMIQTASFGGMLQISDCTFHNNRRDVHIAGSQNSNSWNTYHPLIEDSYSLIDNSHFSPIKERVLLEGSRGSRFSRSSFENIDNTLLNNQQLTCFRAGPSFNYSLGITGSTFSLVDDTPISTSYKRDSIAGFTRGVWATGVVQTYTDYLYIDGMRFADYRGVFSENSRYVRVYRSEFLDIGIAYPYNPIASIGDPTRIVLSNNPNEQIFETSGGPQNITAAYGCYVLGTMTNLNIQENIFDHNNSNVSIRYGFVGTNTGGNASQWVRKNDFTRNDFACSFQGNNRNNQSSELFTTGLKFACNNFGADDLGNTISGMQNEKDVLILSVASSNQGIQLWQNGGEQQMTANNKWSQNSTVLNDDMDETISSVSHNYRENGLSDNPAEYSGIVLQGFSIANTCPSNIGPPQLVPDEGEGATMRQNAEAEITLNKSEYLALVDDGDTEGLTEEVVYTDFDEVLELYYNLMATSPALSEEVMIAAIQKEYELPAALLTEILSNNPSAAKNEAIQLEIENRMLPLDEWQKQQINAGLELVSQKELLEEELSTLISERWAAINLQVDEINYNNSDTDKSLAVMNILDPVHFYSDRQLYIQLLMERGSYIEAIEWLESIPIDFKTDQSILGEIESLSLIWGIEHLAMQSEMPTLSDPQKAQLTDIFYSGNSWASSEALRILYANSEYAYIEPLLECTDRENRELILKTDTNEPQYMVYPNPAENYCTFERLSTESECSLRVVDVNGKVILSFELITGQKQIVIPISELRSGSYGLLVMDKVGATIWNTVLVKIK